MAKAKVKSHHTADIVLPVVGGVIRAGSTRMIEKWEVVSQTDEIKPLVETNVLEVVDEKQPAKVKTEEPAKPKAPARDE